MSDMFYEEVPFCWIEKCFKMFVECPQHQFQVLTKRGEILEQLAPYLPWSDNIWMGVSVEYADYTYRIDHLRHTPAKIKFLSLEPLLDPLDGLNLDGIHWVIVGGESDASCRPMEPDWVRSIRDQCLAAKLAFFQAMGRSERDEESRWLRTGRSPLA
jgi:protein gp37